MLSVSSSSARIRSSISGALIWRKDAAQYFPPMRKRLACPKRKEDGAIKSFTWRPEGASQSQSKEKRSPSGCMMPCSSASHSRPSRAFANAPITLNWFRASRMIRENRVLAVRISFASMVRTNSFVFTNPLFPRSNCLRKIWVYSSRRGSNLSPWAAISIRFTKSSRFIFRQGRDSSIPMVLSWEL